MPTELGFPLWAEQRFGSAIPFVPSFLRPCDHCMLVGKVVIFFYFMFLRYVGTLTFIENEKRNRNLNTERKVTGNKHITYSRKIT